MGELKEVRNNIFWVGTLDTNLKTFDIVLHTDFGTTYNSYVVKGSEKTALFEVCKNGFFDGYIERVKKVTKLEDIEYIVISHTEPDHTGQLAHILEVCPNAKVVGTGVAIKFLKEITNIEFESIIVKDGDSISLGDKTLNFIMAPFLHWPDSMFTYIPEDKTIFTCDCFGAHYCDSNVFDDLIEEDFTYSYKYYYDCILSHFGEFVLRALKKIEDLPIDIICNGHGPVLRKNPKKYMDLYKEWSTPVKGDKPSVVIVYASVYGYTKDMAFEMRKMLEPNIKVHIYDAEIHEVKEINDVIRKSDGLLVGSPTLLGDSLPIINNILGEMNAIVDKGLLAGVFGSYGWSGEGIKNVESRLNDIRIKMPLESIKVCFKPNEDEMNNTREFAIEFGKLVTEKYNKDIEKNKI